MKLDFRQTRRLYLAGTVAFPMPFPSVGEIWIDDGTVSHGSSTHEETFVNLHEKPRLESDTVRVVLKQHVAAIFFPGLWEGEPNRKKKVFHFAECVHDLEQGEWFLTSDIGIDTISEKLGIDIRKRESAHRGIIFVPANRPVLTNQEYGETAGTIASMVRGCDPCRW